MHLSPVVDFRVAAREMSQSQFPSSNDQVEALVETGLPNRFRAVITPPLVQVHTRSIYDKHKSSTPVSLRNSVPSSFPSHLSPVAFHPFKSQQPLAGWTSKIAPAMVGTSLRNEKSLSLLSKHRQKGNPKRQPTPALPPLGIARGGPRPDV